MGMTGACRKKKEKYAPPGKLRRGELLCSKNNNRYKWLVKEQKRTSYLPKSKKELAENVVNGR